MNRRGFRQGNAKQVLATRRGAGLNVETWSTHNEGRGASTDGAGRGLWRWGQTCTTMLQYGHSHERRNHSWQ